MNPSFGLVDIARYLIMAQESLDRSIASLPMHFDSLHRIESRLSCLKFHVIQVEYLRLLPIRLVESSRGLLRAFFAVQRVFQNDVSVSHVSECLLHALEVMLRPLAALRNRSSVPRMHVDLGPHALPTLAHRSICHDIVVVIKTRMARPPK